MKLREAIKTFILIAAFCPFLVNSAYTPHEERFYKTQVDFIKKNWIKVIKNESQELVSTKKLVEISDKLSSTIEKVRGCSSLGACNKEIEALKAKLNNVEIECINLLSKLGGLTLSTVQKSTHRYTLFIKRVTDINHNLSEIKFSLNDLRSTSTENTRGATSSSTDINDLVAISERLVFQISTLPHIFINQKAQDLLTLGNSEFVQHLESDIQNVPVGKFHELDVVFNLMNRDLQKGQELISSRSKSILLQIHQRWNAILKIIKRK